ncbi:MAG: cation acetate symporter [Lacipirellulaceae bacterium]
MIHDVSLTAVLVFLAFVATTLGISFALGARAKSSAGYFAAHGQIPWFVNGVAFAGDYLSAASFLGICGMIAFYGYDGFLYSIGYLAGWVVALFVVAEPMKRLGKFTFADALNARFDSRAIKLSAGISTLVVSLFYLIPQMVGAGALVKPLLGLEHWQGVMIVGAVVTAIVTSAGMVSTTWVQFLKGGLLVAFSAVLTWQILERGLTTRGVAGESAAWRTIGPIGANDDAAAKVAAEVGHQPVAAEGAWQEAPFVRTRNAESGEVTVWSERRDADGARLFDEGQSLTKRKSGERLVNGVPFGSGPGQRELRPVGGVASLPGGVESTGPLGPFEYLRTLAASEVVLWRNRVVAEADGAATTVYYQQPTPGSRVLRPGEHPTFQGIRTADWRKKIDFVSLMLALLCGTASLPHILIRYYTVKDGAAARKSTIVGIACIGFFYVLTLYLGLGAMTSGALDPTDTNMAAPLLARAISEPLFAMISAIAFTTVLGTVSGLILASAGSVTHDLIDSFRTVPLSDVRKVTLAKRASVAVGALAIALGIVFKDLNVTFLVGWAFSIAASANLPSLVMLLFWPRTTKQGIVVAVLVGMTTSLAWVLLSADAYEKVYGLAAADAPAPFSQPGIVTIPLGFVTLVVVSLLTQRRGE